jgi:hypothetical protein
MQKPTAPPGYVPFLIAVKGSQLKTIELSVLRFDGPEMFLSKPESAPPVEQRWRVAPLRWSAEREPFCVLTHRETSRLRLVVAKPDSACELWPVMYASDKPDGGILNCSISPARCKLVSFMWNGGLYLLAVERPGPGGAILQINSPQDPWVCVRDGVGEWKLGGKKTRVTPFYFNEKTYMLVQEEGVVEVREIVDPTAPWKFVTRVDAVGSTPKVLFMYARVPVRAGQTLDTPPVAVFATWTEGCTLFLARVRGIDSEWEIVCTVPVPPHTRLASMYVPFLPEPLLVSSSMDPHYLGSVAVRRLNLSERLIIENEGREAFGNTVSEDDLIPRVIRYMQVPAVPVAVRDLTADLPVSDLPFREFVGDFIAKRLPWDLTPPGVAAGIPPPPRAVAVHPPVPLLLNSCSLAGLSDKSRLDWLGGGSSVNTQWRVTPLRWAPAREALFVLLQSPERKSTRVAIATPNKPVDEWPILNEFPDGTVPFSECRMTPFQYQTVPGTSDLFVLVSHNGEKGGLFFVANPKAEWQFVRAISAETETELLDQSKNITVMYHRSRDPASVNLCTFFVVTDAATEGVSVRVMLEPNQPTFPVTAEGSVGDNLVALYTFAPKPPVTHVWPCEVFMAWIDREAAQLVVAHVPAPDLPWRILYKQSIPATAKSIAPVYLPYLAEPLLLLSLADGSVDLLRLNIVEACAKGANNGVTPRFIQRYLMEGSEVKSIADTTLDTALVWIPQMGLQGMHPYCGYPLPFERQQE